ncbi:hypothetical protein [Dactylosporangium sp. NPDC048998]|uniref:hypothetical protein n=1 Tax=Dactylosporangium sp. NPDC048998 TaxID=3363976 RepID=UPI003720B2E0
MNGHTDDELRGVVAEYEATKNAAIAKRDAALRAFHTAGWRAVDLQRVTGYSRETIRQALHPETRLAANSSRRKTAGASNRPPADYVPFGDRKRYVVADHLAELHGPTTGIVSLPHHLDWSGSAEYVLDRPARLASMYRTVLTEAVTSDDLRNWLDKALLIQLWPSLWLPPQLRRSWEGRFPELADARAAAA